MNKMSILILTFLMAFGANTFAKDKKHKKGHGGIIKQLDLSEEQMAKLNEHRKKMKEAKEDRKLDKEEIKKLREEIKSAFISNASDQTILNLHQKIKNIRSKKEDMRIQKMLQLKSILNETQRAKYLELVIDKRHSRKSK